MTDTIPNVPRELLERASNLAFQTQHYPLHEELRTLLSAPSPAGVDGLAVSSSGWFSLVMNAAAELETASYSITDPDAKRVAQSGADYYRSKAKSAQVVCLSDAQAIIDGLLGEVAGLRKRAKTAEREAGSALRTYKGLEKVARVVSDNSDQVCGELNVLRQQFDQQARRIGELEGLLREVHWWIDESARVYRHNSTSVMLYRIDAALSADKEG